MRQNIELTANILWQVWKGRNQRVLIKNVQIVWLQYRKPCQNGMNLNQLKSSVRME